MRHRLDVVGIDLQRLAHLGGRACELAEDEHAVLVGAGRDELLGHEVHPVAERASTSMTSAARYSAATCVSVSDRCT